jgi:hypothetical protein
VPSLRTPREIHLYSQVLVYICRNQLPVEDLKLFQGVMEGISEGNNAQFIIQRFSRAIVRHNDMVWCARGQPIIYRNVHNNNTVKSRKEKINQGGINRRCICKKGPHKITGKKSLPFEAVVSK